MADKISHMSFGATLAAIVSLAFMSSMSTVAAQPAAEGQVKALTIAGYPAFALLDGAFSRPNDGDSFVLGVPISKTEELLRSNALATDHFDFSIEPLLVRANGRALLFDTGAGPNMGPGAGHLLLSLASAQIRPEEITDIFISHGHGDHVGGLITSEGELTFPNAAVHISRAEWEWLSGMSKDEAAKFIVGNHDALISALTPKVVTFAPGATLIPGVVKAVDIKGHSPGHSGYLIGAGKQTVLFVGDAMHHSIASVAHPEWRIAFDNDRPLAEQSRLGSERHWAETGQHLYAGHFPFPGYGMIVRRGKVYVWRPLL